LDLVEGGNNAALAAFRRGLGKPPGAVPELLRWLSPWTATLGLRDAEVCLLVASLFALYPGEGTGGNIGWTCAALRTGLAGNAGLEDRFVALLHCRRDDLPWHLRRLVALARENAVAVDWAQLMADIRHWDHPERFVQLAWAHTFWGEEPAPKTPAPQPLASPIVYR
jgi:CRISPR system Cascade subunit CasB